MFDTKRLPKHSFVFIMTLTEWMVLPSEAIECYKCNELPLEIHDSCQTNSTLVKYGNRYNVRLCTWLLHYLKQHTFDYFFYLHEFYLYIINHLVGMYNISIRFGKSSISIQYWRCLQDIQSVLEGTKLL